jgi:hypothetical protein
VRNYCHSAIWSILLLICSKSQPDDPIGSKNVAVWILCEVVLYDDLSTPYSKKSVACAARQLRLLIGQPEFDFLKWHVSPSWRLHWLWCEINRLSRQYGSIWLSPGANPPESEGDHSHYPLPHPNTLQNEAFKK